MVQTQSFCSYNLWNKFAIWDKLQVTKLTAIKNKLNRVIGTEII